MSYDTAPLRTLWQEAFGDSDAFLDSFFATAYSPDRCRVLMEGDQALAALYWMPHWCDGRKIAYIYAVATAKSHRGQGLCHRLMAETHEILRAQGYAGAMLVPGSAGLGDFYANMGYRHCTQIREISAVSDSQPIPIRNLTVAEYALLRKNMLPENSVLPGDEALTFLAAQAVFNAGDGWLLAGYRQDDAFIGLEFLGDETKIPGILAALDTPKGHFRTPGIGRPFAMYLPFTDHPTPAYFAFAFD
jgi:GNAT superfamily N-acetyltransferase